ncbi:IclR family transcriptional regulator domain-containing protein [Streptomyces hypolithicus]
MKAAARGAEVTTSEAAHLPAGRSQRNEPPGAPPWWRTSSRYSAAYLASCGLPDALEPPAVALADELDESVSIAVPDGDGVRFITQATRRRAMSLAFRIGDLLPAERCAPGAIFAAEWTDADRERWLTRRREDPLDTNSPPYRPASRRLNWDKSRRSSTRASRWVAASAGRSTTSSSNPGWSLSPTPSAIRRA